MTRARAALYILALPALTLLGAAAGELVLRLT